MWARRAWPSRWRAQYAGRFADGVVFVRLDGLSDPALVLPALSSDLRLLETGGGRSLLERLAGHLSSRDMLLVLDNLEHLLPAAADLADLLHRAPRLTMLATSREALRVGGERIFAVAPLPRPDPTAWQEPGAAFDLEQFPAVSLFIQRALAAPPVLQVDPATPAGRANLAVIAETCHRLDGLPLAIELAAAQAQVLSPAAILALMKQAGLPLLVGGARDQPARLQTMEAAIAWSYNLLSAEEQRRFRALSVFAGGFSLPAAAAVFEPTPVPFAERQNGLAEAEPTLLRVVSGEPDLEEIVERREELAGLDPMFVRAIASLARQNLVFRETAVPDHAALRFRMLEPIRLFALDRLRAAGEETDTRRRHALHFAASAAELDALTLGPDPEVWLEQQVLDLDNIRAALDWSLAAGDHDLAVRTTGSIAQLWLIKGLLSEARLRVAAAIAVDGASSPADRWFLRFWAGTFAHDVGDLAAAAGHARELLDIATSHDDRVGIGVGLTMLSRAVGAHADRHEEAAELARQAVATLEPLGLGEWTGWAWSRLGIEEHCLGRLAEARESLLQSLEIRRAKRCEGCASYSSGRTGASAARSGSAGCRAGRVAGRTRPDGQASEPDAHAGGAIGPSRRCPSLRRGVRRRTVRAAALCRRRRAAQTARSRLESVGAGGR